METLRTVIDIHTHHPAPQPHALVCVTPEEFDPIPDQLYSVGIHPWLTNDEIPGETWQRFEEVSRHPQVMAIGECGIDLVKGGPLFRQMQVFKRQADLAEELGKPLVIHNVHAHDVIIGLKRDMNPSQFWMVHGFRGKPTVARMLADTGIWISFGPVFNDNSVPEVPIERMLAETDEAETTIQQVVTALSVLRGHDLTAELTANASAFLGLNFSRRQ